MQFLRSKGGKTIPDSIMASMYAASMPLAKNDVSRESAEVRSFLKHAPGSVSGAFLLSG